MVGLGLEPLEANVHVYLYLLIQLKHFLFVQVCCIRGKQAGIDVLACKAIEQLERKIPPSLSI